MQEIHYDDRLIFGNIFIQKNNAFILLNLYSFRRMLISKHELQVLLSCRDNMRSGMPISDVEKELYDRLVSKMQIIPDDILSIYLAEKAKKHTDDLSKVYPKISRITISPTFSCNFNCLYCYQRNFKSKKDVLPPEAVDKICDTLKKINATECYLDGVTEVTINGGEPLQLQNIGTINRIIEHFAKPGIKFSLFTNGYNILRFKDQIDFSRFTCIQVSLDNIDPYASNINGVKHPVSREVLEGLSYLMQFDCKITISAVLTRELLTNIDEFIEQLASIGLVESERCHILITPIVAFGKSTLDESFYTINDFIDTKKLLKSKQLPSNLSVGGLPETRWIARALQRAANERIYGKPSMCSILVNRSIHFAPNGHLYWCLCVNPDTGSLGSFYPSIDIDDVRIDSCINKSVFSEEKCKTCAYQFLCSSGCPLHAVSATGDYSKPFCGFFFNPEFWSNLEALIE